MINKLQAPKKRVLVPLSPQNKKDDKGEHDEQDTLNHELSTLMTRLWIYVSLRVCVCVRGNMLLGSHVNYTLPVCCCVVVHELHTPCVIVC